MHVFRGLPHALQRRPTALAIGNFDGVHTGHQALLQGVAEAAAARGLLPAVVTFEPHPRERFGVPPARISTLRDKVGAMLACGIERVHMFPFHTHLAAMSAEDFVRRILVEGLHAEWITVGEDFRFGSDRKGDVALLERMGQELHFETAISPTLYHADARVSSTRVRRALAAGDFYEAEMMLGRRYALTGRVIHGKALGRTLGFPTLNIAPLPPGSKADPAVRGVYAVEIEGLGPAVYPGVASLGLRPTVASERRWLLETHVFDWQGDAYGRILKINFVHKIRDEKKFSGLEELRAAIDADAQTARRLLGASLA